MWDTISQNFLFKPYIYKEKGRTGGKEEEREEREKKKIKIKTQPNKNPQMPKINQSETPCKIFLPSTLNVFVG